MDTEQGTDPMTPNLTDTIADRNERIATEAALEADEYWKARILELESEVAELRAAIRKVLSLPNVKEELRLLDKGIGTKTKNAAWLELRTAVAGGGTKAS